MNRAKGEDSAGSAPIGAPLSRKGSQGSLVGAVVVTWNSAAWVKGILSLLSEASAQGFRKIVFVDTGSTDDTVALLRAEAPGCAEVIQTSNGGYAAGLNAGLRAFGEDRPPFFLLLNPDLTAEPGFLDRMFQEVAKHPSEKIGIAGPSIREPIAGGGWIEANGRKRNLWGWPSPNSGDSAIAWTDAVHGACLLIRKEVVERVGLFDEDYFLYWEEIDYCARARHAGFRVARIEAARVRHHPGEVRDGKNEKSAAFSFYFWRNQWLYARKIYGPWAGTLFLLLRSPIWCREALRLLLAGETGRLLTTLEGLRAGLLGQSGRPERASFRETVGRADRSVGVGSGKHP